MINFYDQVPTIYNNASRDFQYLSWLINIVLNSVKHNVDDLYSLPKAETNPKLIALLAMTLGFKIKRNYNQIQLIALVGVLPEILRYKGTQKAIDLAGAALIKASGVTGTFQSKLTNNCLEIQLPEQLVDTVLFMDLLPYILPAGITTRVVVRTDIEKGLRTELDYQNTPIADIVSVLDGNDNTMPTGLATLFDAGKADPVFTNFTINQGDEKAPNFGLLDNSIIPSLDYREME